jgi:hypothetical protein
MYKYIYYYIILSYITLYYITLYYIILHYIILYHIISSHITSYHIISESYCIILYYIILYYIILYYIYIYYIYIYIFTVYYQYHNPIVNPYWNPLLWLGSSWVNPHGRPSGLHAQVWGWAATGPEQTERAKNGGFMLGKMVVLWIFNHYKWWFDGDLPSGNLT